MSFHFVKKDGTESIAKIGIVKVSDIFPETVITVPAFGNKTVNMWIPSQYFWDVYICKNVLKRYIFEQISQKTYLMFTYLYKGAIMKTK